MVIVPLFSLCCMKTLSESDGRIMREKIHGIEPFLTCRDHDKKSFRCR